MAILSEHKRPRALITGLRGFTGEYLARELSAIGYEIYGTAYGNEALGPGVFYVDLCDPIALQEVVNQVKPDIVAHLAAISFVGHGNVEDIYRINVVGTRNLLSALSQLTVSPRSVLIASSANIYGNATPGMIAETASPLPANDYAVSKLAMEHVARLWMDKLPIFITRPFNYTGVGQVNHFLLPKIISHFKRKATHIELGNLDVARDFSDVRNIARAYSALLQKAPAGETYNICTGNPTTLREVIQMVEHLAGYEIEVRVNPDFVRANEVRVLVGNPDKLRSCIGDLPAIALRQTLQWMLASESQAIAPFTQEVHFLQPKVIEVAA